MFKVRRYHDTRHPALEAVKILDDTGNRFAATLATLGQSIARLITADEAALCVMVRVVLLARVGIGVLSRPRDRRAALALDRFGYDLLNHPTRQSGC